MKKSSKTLPFLAVLFALSVSLSYAEGFLTPFLPLGMKPGLSHIAVMFTVTVFPFPYALTLVLLKAGFALLTRGLVAGGMSFCGGLLSVCVSWFCLRKKDGKWGYIGTGIFSALGHNTGQFLLSLLLFGKAAFGYLPWLLLLSFPAGGLTGTVLGAVTPALKKIRDRS
ncbi:MAG: Gx transporter family protein [Clostridia bacterium]|nr:Gx transporter family protein [Clostridia bacterium]